MLLTIVADDTTAAPGTIAARLSVLEETGNYLEDLLTGLLAELDDDDAA